MQPYLVGLPKSPPLKQNVLVFIAYSATFNHYYTVYPHFCTLCYIILFILVAFMPFGIFWYLHYWALCDDLVDFKL